MGLDFSPLSGFTFSQGAHFSTLAQETNQCDFETMVSQVTLVFLPRGILFTLEGDH